MKVTKSKIDLYKVRGDCIQGWADISIDSGSLDSSHGKQNCFRVSISSDYGDWAYFWSHPGECWRSFLLSTDMWYIASKFGADDWFDIDGTVKFLKQNIAKQCRESGEVSLEARDAFSAINSAESEYGHSKDLFFKDIMESDWANFWGEHWFDQLETITDIHPRFKAFWEDPWKAFLNQLNAEKNSRSSIKHQLCTN